MRHRWVYINGEAIKVTEDYKPEPRKTDWRVMPDIQPYKSMIDGREITSRSRHREHLRAHGCIEIGNETKYINKEKGPMQSPEGLKRQIAEIANEKLRR